MTEQRPYTQAQQQLKEAGLRLTKQRLALGRLLLEGPNRHVTAESFHDEAVRAGIKVSLATIYNTLNQFTEVGLLRQLTVDSNKIYFDTNISDHHHFFFEESEELADIDAAEIKVNGLPAAPEGTSVERVDVIVRLKIRD